MFPKLIFWSTIDFKLEQFVKVQYWGDMPPRPEAHFSGHLAPEHKSQLSPH
jgi:hypothetical protein